MKPKIEKSTALSSSVQIEQFYAREILTGRLPPGSRLPSNEELAKKWKTSVRSIHKALGGLVAQGLLERKQRRGTFVRDQNQNAVVGILVGPHLVSGGSPYFRQLSHEIEMELERSRFSCRTYHDLLRESNLDPLKTRSIRRFLLDRTVYDFKGFVYIGTAIIKAVPGLEDLHPRVVHLDSTRGLDAVIDMPHFLRTTLKELSSRGLKKVAYVCPSWKVDPANRPPNLQPEDLECELIAIAEEIGIPVPQLWNIDLEEQSFGMEQEAFDIVFAGLKGHRLGKGKAFPQVIIVPDDIIAHSVIAALQHRGLSIPEDIKIAILSVAEVKLFYGAPIYRYEFSLQELAKEMVSILRARISRSGKPNVPFFAKGRFLDMA